MLMIYQVSAKVMPSAPAPARRRRQTKFRVCLEVPGEAFGRSRRAIPEYLTYFARNHREAAQKAHEWLVSYGRCYYGVAYRDWLNPGAFYRVKQSYTPKGTGVKYFALNEFRA